MARYLAKGTTLKMGDGLSPEGFTAVGQATTIDGPTMTRGDVDLSDHDSVGAKNVISDPLYDPGAVSFTCNFDPNNSTHAALLTAFQGNTMRNWQLGFPSTPSKKLSFQGTVNKMEPKAPATGGLTFDGSVRVYGPVALS